MKRRVNGKHLRNNALARYINEASYSFVNEGFLNEKKEPQEAFARFFHMNSSSPSPEDVDISTQEVLPQDNLLSLLAAANESASSHHARRKIYAYISLINVFSHISQQREESFFRGDT